jgi:hypothetical protein
MDKTNKYYECHITLLCDSDKDISTVKWLTEARGWSFSRIDGDIVEGAGVKCYATRHYHSKYSVETIIGELNRQANMYRHEWITRKKIELVVYDTKSDKIRPDSI